MTYNDLEKEVLALGFESVAPQSDTMLTAANRALFSLFVERDEKKRADVENLHIGSSFAITYAL